MSGFVKLDSAILTSSLWFDRDMRSVFITALLMAEPMELKEPMEEIAVRSLDKTGWSVPPGWYGFVPAAGIGIVRRDGVDQEEGMAALERLATADLDSRSAEFDGRRMVRVNGGFIVLNYFKYRDHDYTAADRQRRLRERRKGGKSVTRDSNDVTRDNRDGVTEKRDVTREVTHSREQIADSRVTTTTKATTSDSGESGNGESKPTPEKPPSWVAEGVEWWVQNVGATNHGRFGKALTEAVRAWKWPEVFDALKCYVEDANARNKTPKPEWFAAEIIHWLKWAQMPATDEKGLPTPRGRAIDREFRP